MNTRARIATVCQAGRLFRSAQENRAHVLDLLDLALKQNPDLVCLPETFATAGVPGSAADLAETVPGPTTDACAERARRARCYVVCPLLTRRRVGGQERVYNSAVLLDRSGNVAGVYDKRYPVTCAPDYTRFEDGVFPGDSDGVFDLDFGRIGVRICFDAGFADDWQMLSERDVRLVFWPSAYHGGTPLAAYAALHRYYVVTSVRTDRSRIVDPCGILLCATDRLANVVWRDINLDFAVCHYDFNLAVPDRLLAALGGRVEVRSHPDDALFLVEPTDPALTTEALMAQYGFEAARRYYARHRDAYAELARGREPAPQCAAHGDRPMYSKHG